MIGRILLESTHRCSLMDSTDAYGGRVALVHRVRTRVGETPERVCRGRPGNTLTHAARRELVGVCDAPCDGEP